MRVFNRDAFVYSAYNRPTGSVFFRSNEKPGRLLHSPDGAVAASAAVSCGSACDDESQLCATALGSKKTHYKRE